MASNAFKRYEKKYLLTPEQYSYLLPRLREHMEPDAYCLKNGFYTVCTVYFDTPCASVARRCADFKQYKEKLRLRSYGTPKNGDSKVFLCLKRKLLGEGNKRRAVLRLDDAREFLRSGKRPEGLGYIDSQVLDEIAWFMQALPGLEPAMYIGYDREAFFGRESPELRLTFDRNILWRRESPSLSAGNWGEPLLDAGERLLEIKIPGAMPLWMAAALSKAEAFPTGFSKYGRAFASEQSAALAEIS